MKNAMKTIETYTISAKGPLTEDLIVETPHYYGVFDGVSGVRKDWLEEGRTMGQWAAHLAGEALLELPENASAAEYAARATEKLAAARKTFALSPADRLATAALILPCRKPLQVWIIGDSHFGYLKRDRTWVPMPQSKIYDDITLAFRQIIITQEIMERGEPKTNADRLHLATTAWEAAKPAITKQMLWANHPDPAQKLGFGVLCGTPVPAHHIHIHDLPDDTAEVVLCSDGFPLPTPTAAEGQDLLAHLRAADPLLIGNNDLQFMAHRAGFVAADGSVGDVYDDVSYIRIGIS
jgi:hypothetical protein